MLFKIVCPTMSVFALRRKSRFLDREILDFPLDANNLDVGQSPSICLLSYDNLSFEQ